ncbi:MAG: hypothetical protein ACPGVU_11220 [Limisphaerales bacterium]
MKAKKQPNSILGLTLEGKRLDSALLKRGRGGFRLQGSASSELSLDPLVDDPELVGREIKDQLNDAGLSEKNCAVGVPLEWTLTTMVTLPDMPEEHMDGFIRLQAEKSFPFSLSDLSLSVSRFENPEGEKLALVTAIPLKHIDLVERTLNHAGLKPVSFTLGVVAQQETLAEAEDPVVLLFVNADNVSLLINGKGGPVCVRTLKDAYVSDDPVKRLNGHAVGRELRITMGQLPPAIRAKLKKIRIIGAPGLASTLETEIAARATALGLTVETVTQFQPNGQPINLPFAGSVSPAVALAARYLKKSAQTLEFLPPKVSQWQKVAEKMASKKAGILSAVAGAIVVISLIAFLWQYRTLSNLESEWADMRDKVKELEVIQGKKRKFGSWYDQSQPTLSALRAISTAFPASSKIRATSLEFREGSKVSISGEARDSTALFDLTDKLREVEEIEGVKTLNTQGSGPIRFTIELVWKLRVRR